MKNDLWARNCPACGKTIKYTNQAGLKLAIKRGRNCRPCSATEINLRPGLRDAFIQRYATKENCTGSDNPFYGHQHSEETKARLRQMDTSYRQGTQFRQKMSEVTQGRRNPMYGRTFFDIWVEKYGLEEANKKLAQKKIKNSEASSGCNNPMFGKPSPQGSGNGWKGWYKNQHFRSLRELCFLIGVEESGDSCRPAETIEIQYQDYRGTARTYRPDFILNEKIVVECKPIKLWNTPSVTAKKLAAQTYCHANGLEYRLIDYGIPPAEQMTELMNVGHLKLEAQYEAIFRERYQ